MSDSLRPHELQHARPPCPSPTPRVHPNSCPWSQWCHPTISSSVIPFSSSLQSSPASVFSDESALLIRWLKYWSFSFNISPSNEHPGLISFRMDWLDLRVIQGTIKSLLQHHSSKASILRHSAFFVIQLSHLYMTTGKTVPLTRWIYSYISGNHLSLSSTPEPFFLKPIFDSFRFLWIVRTSESSSSGLITNCFLPQPCFSCRSSPLPRH